MVNLGDYLGKLMSEITWARVQADIEATRVAEIYASDPLLRNFPVPRIRLPNVEINVPVVVNEVEEGGPADVIAGVKVEPKTVKELANNIVEQELHARKIAIGRKNFAILNKAVMEKATDIHESDRPPFFFSTIATEITQHIAQTLKAMPETAKLDAAGMADLAKTVENRLGDALLGTRVPPRRVKISALTKDIREAGDVSNVVTLKLSVKEEAIQWTGVETAEGSKNLLVPE